MQNAELLHFTLFRSQGSNLSAECGVRSAERPHSTLFRSQGKFFNAECKVQNAEFRGFADLYCTDFNIVGAIHELPVLVLHIKL